MSQAEFQPKQYSLSELIHAVRIRRNIKKASREVHIGGAPGNELSRVLGKAFSIEDAMLGVHADWIDRKIEQILPYFTEAVSKSGVENKTRKDPEKQIREAFSQGFSPVISQEFRLAKGTPDSQRVSSENGLEDIITAYSFDFFRTLRVCQRMGVYPDTALKIAQLSFRFNPNILVTLHRNPKFKVVSMGVIERAVTHHRNTYETFLEEYVKKSAELFKNPKYKDVSQNILNSALLYATHNPEGYVDRYLEKILSLRSNPRYVQVSAYVLERALASSPANPEVFLNRFITNTKKLQSDPRYNTLNPNVIERAVLSYPADTERFLDWFKETYDKFRIDPRYKDLGVREIERAILHSSMDPESYLNALINK